MRTQVKMVHVHQIRFKEVVLIFVSIFIMSSQGLDFVNGKDSILDISYHNDAIFLDQRNDLERENLELLLGKELSPLLYFATDYSHDVFTSLSIRLSNVSNWIQEIDRRRDLNYKRKFLVSLRSNATFEDVPELSEETIQALQDNVVGLLISRSSTPTTSCDPINVRHSSKSLVQEIKHLLASGGAANLQVGVEYNDHNIRDCYSLFGVTADPTDFYILTLDLEAEVGFPESYGMFSNFIDSVVKTNKDFFDVQLYPRPNVVLRLNLKSRDGKYSQEFKFYQKLMKEFVTRWQKETGKRIIFNLNLSEVAPSDLRGNLRESRLCESCDKISNSIMPFWFDDNNQKSDEICLSRRLNQIGTKFENLLLGFDVWTKIVQQNANKAGGNSTNQNLCRKGYENQTSEEIPSNIVLLVNLKECEKRHCSKPQEILDNIRHDIENGNLNIKHIVFSFDNYSTTHFPILPTHNDMTYGCLTNFGDLNSDLTRIPEVTSKTCPSSLLNSAKILIWEFNLDLKSAYNSNFSFDFYTNSIQVHLHDIFQTVSHLRKIEPEKEVVLSLVAHTPKEFGRKQGIHLFCDPSILGSNILFETIANWAYIHKVRVVLKPAFDTGLDIGWWSTIEKDMFVSRNYPPQSNFGNDPCIPSKENINERFIFKPESHVRGVIIDMSTRLSTCRHSQDGSLTVDELKVMLTFGLSHFSKVELVPRSNSSEEFTADLETITQLISTESTLEMLLETNDIKGSILVNIPIKFISFPQVGNFLAASNISSSSLLKLEGIHVSGITKRCVKNANQQTIPTLVQKSTVQCDSEADLSEISSILEEFSQFTKVGLVFPRLDCFRLARGEGSSSEKEWIEKVAYLVCSGPVIFPAGPTTVKIVTQSYLDIHMKTKAELLALFPNLDNLIVRPVLHTDLSEPESWEVTVSRYLSYIFQIRNYADAYKVDYLIPGFDDNCSHNQFYGGRTIKLRKNGWWKISNYSDLANSSVYVEAHSDSLGLQTWRPINIVYPESVKEKEKQVEKYLIPIPWIMGLTSGLLFVIILPLLYFIYRLRRKVRVLSKKEVRDFFRGTPSIDCLILSTEIGGENYLTRGFDKKFEIPKQDFLTVSSERRILGSGNFGTVYEANIRGAHVAVKVPKQNCSSDSFRSLLSEVKILSYLGVHPHLLEFVGCYTKEIDMGVIYIATKLCERGSLQDYLRNEFGQGDGSDENIYWNTLNIPELIRFSAEIASGMEYIASKAVVHGDLSTRNVLLDGNLSCKVGDFGLSRKMYEYAKYVKHSQEPLPWRWMAYETLMKMEFTSKSDVWSYGVTLWEIFSLGAIPYPGLAWNVDFTDDLRKGVRMASPQFATCDIYETMRKCWELDSEARPQFKELQEFFSHYNNTSQLYNNI